MIKKYAADDIVLVKPNQMPTEITGAGILRKGFMQRNSRLIKAARALCTKRVELI